MLWWEVQTHAWDAEAALRPDQEEIWPPSWRRWQLSLAPQGEQEFARQRPFEGRKVGSAVKLPEPGDRRVGLVWGTEISQVAQPRRRPRSRGGVFWPRGERDGASYSLGPGQVQGALLDRPGGALGLGDTEVLQSKTLSQHFRAQPEPGSEGESLWKQGVRALGGGSAPGAAAGEACQSPSGAAPEAGLWLGGFVGRSCFPLHSRRRAFVGPGPAFTRQPRSLTCPVASLRCSGSHREVGVSAPRLSAGHWGWPAQQGPLGQAAASQRGRAGRRGRPAESWVWEPFPPASGYLLCSLV